MNDELAEIQRAALKHLNRREHSRTELAGKLKRRRFRPEAVSAVLDQLVESGVLSDERFAESYVHYRSDRGFGPYRIMQELRERGVADTIAAACVLADSEEWLERLAAVRRKRFGDGLPREFAERARQRRFLEYRGFSSEQIRRLFEGAGME